MRISFCITCMGRVHHLKETLPQNIRDNPKSDGLDVEFIVLNYNSQDDLHDWITTDLEMAKHIESGLIKYGRTTEPEFFHMSHAKNMAHRMASGDVICNLDADNFTGKGFAKLINKIFSEDMNIVVNPSHRISKYFSPDERGFFGRIIISKDNFFKLGGYDENFYGWGGEDQDFMQRAKGMGVKHKRIDTLKYLNIITHTDEDRIVNMMPSHKKEAELEKINNMKHKKYFLLTRLFNKLKVLAKPIQVNIDGDFGTGNVEMHDGQKYVLDKVQNHDIFYINICARGILELIRGRIYPRIV